METLSVVGLLVVVSSVCMHGANGRAVVQHVELQQHQNRERPFKTPMPEADGNLNMYMLPTGQGDSQIVQCPDGTLSIIDMGRSFEEDNPKFWQPEDIRTFLSGKLDRIRNILVTHNHYDHYILIPDTFTGVTLPSVQNIYISCQSENMNYRMQEWIEGSNLNDKLRTFNNGGPCGPNDVSCGNLDLCPNDPSVTARVLAANLGQHCTSGNKNMDSILFKLQWNSVSVMMTGDFEDETGDWDEVGPMRQVVDFYGSEMESTVYKLSHHGASRLSNKPFFREAINPKAIFATANPEYSYYRHPRCVITDGFPALCKPGETDSSSLDYCGDHTSPELPLNMRLQSIFTCGGSSSGELFTRTSNDLAIYTTTPDTDTINLVKFSTDGTRWGFTVNIE